VSEIADAEPPHRPGGCPFQAWSLGELLRASRLAENQIVADHDRVTSRRARAAV
jgi:glycogen debranching enzyme